MKKPLFIACFFAIAAVPCLAATISVQSFNLGNYTMATGSGVIATENFEGFGEGSIEDGFATDAGSFATLGGTGSGGTIKNAGFDIDPTMLALRDGRVYGRRSTTKYLTGNAEDEMFLDSSATRGIAWTASAGGEMFNRLIFSLTDAADEGGILEVVVGDRVHRLENQFKNRKLLVTIGLEDRVTEIQVFFRNVDANGALIAGDGFSLDDIALANVPLPASAALLLAGLGGMAAVRRRKKA